MNYQKPTIAVAGIASQAIQGLMDKGPSNPDGAGDPQNPQTTTGSYAIDE